MDSYSGRIPLNFISFYLGMTTETQGTSGVTSEDSRPEELDQAVPGSVTTVSEPRPPSNFSGSSAATEESLSTYAERTMKAIIARDQPGTSGISALLSPLNEQTEGTSGGKDVEQRRPGTSSQKDSEELQRTGVEKTVFGQVEQDDTSIVSIPVVGCSIDPALYYTDTSGTEDLLDSSGVGGPVTPQFKNIPTLVKVPRQRGESTSEDESSNGLPGPSDQQSKAPRQFSASGRTLLRKHIRREGPDCDSSEPPRHCSHREPDPHSHENYLGRDHLIFLPPYEISPLTGHIREGLDQGEVQARRWTYTRGQTKSQ